MSLRRLKALNNGWMKSHGVEKLKALNNGWMKSHGFEKIICDFKQETVSE